MPLFYAVESLGFLIRGKMRFHKITFLRQTANCTHREEGEPFICLMEEKSPNCYMKYLACYFNATTCHFWEMVPRMKLN